MSQKILAVVAGEEITQGEFDAFLHAVPQDRQAYISNPQFQEQCLEQLISLRLFAKLGETMDLEQSDNYKKIMGNARKDILAQLAMAEVMKGIDVSEEEAKEYYEANQQQYQKGASMKAKHILTDSEETCSAVLASITSGEKTFEEAAKESSSCPSGANGGSLGEFGKGQMVKEFEDAAFAAEIGHVVGPVKTQFGFHLIKVEEKKEAVAAPFEEVKDSVRMNLIQKKQNVVYTDKVKELKALYVQA